MDTERPLIGALLILPDQADLTAPITTGSDFADPALGELYELLISLHTTGQGFDAATIGRKIRPDLLERVGGVGSLIKMASVDCPNPKAATDYARAVRDAATKRKLQSALLKANADIQNPTIAAADIAEALEAKLSAIRSRGEISTETIGEAIDRRLGEIEQAATIDRPASIATGINAIDDATGGLFANDLIILAARPSIGKSALAAQIASNVAGRGQSVLFVSLEMTSGDLANRKLAALCGVEVRSLRSNYLSAATMERAKTEAAKIRSIPFHILSTRQASMAKIRAVAKVQAATRGLALVVVDYLGLIQPTDRRKDRWESITEISGELKSLAMELRVPMLCLCQLNRAAEGARPTLANLRDAGAIEQDADVVALLHRETRDSADAVLDIAKARNGSTGDVSLRFDPGKVEFAGAGYEAKEFADDGPNVF